MTDETNEIIAAARDAKAHRVGARDDAGRWPLKAIGLGVGIGSAAVAAALLYANRDKGGEGKGADDKVREDRGGEGKRAD